MPPQSREHRHETDAFNNGNMTINNNSRLANSQTRATTNTIYSRPGRRKHAALQEFIAGLSLYCACVFLPSLPRYLYLIYQWVKSYARAVGERLLWYIWVSWRFSVLIMERWGWIADPLEQRKQGYEDLGGGGTGKRVRLRSFLRKFLSTSTAASLWEEFNQQEIRGAGATASSSSTAYTWGFGWSSSAYPAIAMVLFDIQILTMLAVTLAIIRIWFVHMLVPEYLAPRRLEALTRCKSSHLLSSSSYKFDGEARLESAARQVRNESNEDRGWYDRLVRRASFHWYR